MAEHPHDVVVEAEQIAEEVAARCDQILIRVGPDGFYILTPWTSDPTRLARRLHKILQAWAGDLVALTHELGGCVDPDCHPRCRYNKCAEPPIDEESEELI